MHSKKQSFCQVLKNIETSMMTELSNALSISMQEEATCIFTPSEEENS